ncbi:adenylate/guanylate cyclase domain-containing protein [Sandarakinorhabdus sp.]|uniref:adenylate/guanylate cyclase domain-containing protein n=1 Tax=Sandarakinorhabdus sp. TaxID=1916663 RepID=UPI00286DFBA6|nr:adenylate/guanylate cyclase domain-containing protein [Sandarakinorhabdus sp.]
MISLLPARGPYLYAVLASAAIGVAAAQLPPLVALENLIGDQRVSRLTPSVPLATNIVIVAFDEASLAALPSRSPIDRQALATIIERVDAGQPRVIGLDILLDQPTSPAADERLAAVLAQARAPMALAASGPRVGAFEARMLGRQPRRPPVLQADAVDGVVRQLAMPAGTSLAALLAARAGIAGSPPTSRFGVPRTAEGALPFARIPARSLLAGDVNASVFTGRIVLIGSTAPGVDQHPTPLRVFGGAEAAGTPGVAIHAYQLRAVLGSSDTPFTSIWRDLLLAGLAAAAGMALAHTRLHPAVRAGLAGLALALLGLAGFAAFAADFWLANLVAASLALGTALAIGSAQALRASHRQSQLVQSTFERFLAPDIVAQLMQHPERVTAGAAPREIAVLFTDLGGFTALLERMSPNAGETLLNTYLALISEIVIHHGGTIDKIVGDSIHAIFGAPIDQPDAAARACACALEIDAAAETFRRDHAAARLEATRIGVHFGTALVGNFGGRDRLDYTAHGPVMNIGARLEHANKALGTRVCVSAATLAAGRIGKEDWLPVGSLALRGVADPLAVLTPAPPRLDRGAYAAALALVPANPLAALSAMKALGSDHPVVLLHIVRLQQGLASTAIDLS